MTLERITESNIRSALQVQAELFPGESARANYEESAAGISSYEYYLIHDGGLCIGIIGLYCCPVDPESAWLGWFGIRKPYRRKHFGSEALKMFEDLARTREFKFARLYTDAEHNEIAMTFYKANGYTCEPYRNEQDPACLKIKTAIFSKPLVSEKLVPWGSRNIRLTEQIAKQEKYSGHESSANGGISPADDLQ